jgi:hypothetical protein
MVDRGEVMVEGGTGGSLAAVSEHMKASFRGSG